MCGKDVFLSKIIKSAAKVMMEAKKEKIITHTLYMDVVEAVLSEVFKVFDENQDEKISYTEIFSNFINRDSAILSLLKTIFMIIDSNTDGIIGIEDIFDSREIFEEEDTNRDIIKLIQLIDVNQDKQFDWEEVQNFVQIVSIFYQQNVQSSCKGIISNKESPLPRVMVPKAIELVLQSIQGFIMPALERIVYEIIRLSDSNDDGMSFNEFLEWSDKGTNIGHLFNIYFRNTQQLWKSLYESLDEKEKESGWESMAKISHYLKEEHEKQIQQERNKEKEQQPEQPKQDTHYPDDLSSLNNSRFDGDLQDEKNNSTQYNSTLSDNDNPDKFFYLKSFTLFDDDYEDTMNNTSLNNSTSSDNDYQDMINNSTQNYSTLSQEYIRPILDIFQAYLSYILDMSHVYLRHISGLSWSNLKPILGNFSSLENSTLFDGDSQDMMNNTSLNSSTLSDNDYPDSFSFDDNYTDTMKNTSLDNSTLPENDYLDDNSSMKNSTLFDDDYEDTMNYTSLNNSSLPENDYPDHNSSLKNSTLFDDDNEDTMNNTSLNKSTLPENDYPDNNSSVKNSTLFDDDYEDTMNSTSLNNSSLPENDYPDDN